MVTINAFRKSAISFPEVTEEPHFEKTSFRVKKKIFATYDAKNKRACVKLSLADQGAFCSHDESLIYPVNGAFGKQGWTLIEMEAVDKDLFADALASAYCGVAPVKLAEKIGRAGA